jgi:hypothetical protein
MSFRTVGFGLFPRIDADRLVARGTIVGVS